MSGRLEHTPREAIAPRIGDLRTRAEFASTQREREAFEAEATRLLHERQAAPARRALLCSGHMIDRAGRSPPRFPPAREGFVAAAIDQVMDRWQVSTEDVALCGGACGADILFAEAAQRRGALVQILRSLPDEEFRASSLRPDGDASWERRYDALCQRGAEVLDRVEHVGEPPAGVSPFVQTNRWLIHSAVAATAGPTMAIMAILVWDGLGTADGPGGTADFRQQLLALGCTPEIIDPRP